MFTKEMIRTEEVVRGVARVFPMIQTKHLMKKEIFTLVREKEKETRRSARNWREITFRVPVRRHLLTAECTPVIYQSIWKNAHF